MSHLETVQPSKHLKLSLDAFPQIPVAYAIDDRNPKRKRTRSLGCSFLLVLLIVYFFAPFRTNLLILGVDDSLNRGDLGRTDTIILVTVVPPLPYIGLLGIPRDLWVDVPGVGQQRINTAYFFAEANQAGTGAQAAVRTVRENFGVSLHYDLVLHMSGLVDFVNSIGGVDIALERPLGGLPPGYHHLDGTQALAFVRDRYSGDDFSRMQQGQIFIQASIRKAFQPGNWIRLPGALWSLTQVIDTNIPIWQWPRLGFTFLRAMILGFDSHTISTDMVVPFQTAGGAQVLRPNWEAINPLLLEMFGE